MAAAISSLALGKLLQTMFSNGVRYQLSRDHRDWDMIKMWKVSDAKGRALDYLMQTSGGPAAIQYRNANQTAGSGYSSSATFPAAQRVTTQELEAEYKELDLTIEIDYNLWKRLQKSPDRRYFDSLALEMQSKMDMAKRRDCADLYGSGTGVVGTCSATNAVSGGNVVFTLSSSNTADGHVGFFEKNDILVLKATAGGASAFDSNLATEPAYWLVVDRNRRNNTVTLQGLDSNLAAVTIASITTPTTAGDVFYRYGQPTIPNLGSISDYGFATEVKTGLESLSASDGRTVNGLVMSGFTGGSRFDAGAVNVDLSHYESALNDAKIAVGEGAYSYKRGIMAPETHSSFVESRETDRRFTTMEDAKRGTKVFGYQHRQDFVESYVTEYCPKNRIYMIPEVKGNQNKVIEYYGSDFETVKVNDSSEFMLKTSSNGYERKVQTFMEAYGNFIVNHPAAIAVIHNFTIA